jgi:hypothetical protein
MPAASTREASPRAQRAKLHPSSAVIPSAVHRATPGMVSSRTSASACGAVRGGLPLRLLANLDLPSAVAQFVARDRVSGDDLVYWQASPRNPRVHTARRFAATH